MADFTVRQALESEFINIREFVAKLEELYAHENHFYKIMLRYFNNTFFIAEADGEIIGALWGFLSQVKPDTFFLWQIGVEKKYRKKGAAAALIKKTETAVKEAGGKKIELTIAPDNIKCQRLFEKSGYENISARDSSIIEINGIKAIKDYYSPGRHFTLYSKKL